MSDDKGQQALLDTLSELRRERDSLKAAWKMQADRIAKLERETKMVDAAWAFVHIDIRRREADRRFREAKAEIRSEYSDHLLSNEQYREFRSRVRCGDAFKNREELLRAWRVKLNAMRRAAEKAGAE